MMRKYIFFTIVSLFIAGVPYAQDVKFQPLYPSGAEESNGLKKENQEITADYLAGGVDADYALFLPDKDKATGQAVVICPGGSYHGVAYNNEGIRVARWMAEQGVAAVVLRYRMPNTNYKIPLKDVHTAIKMVRANSVEWGVDPKNVGIMGFSAGGHLASTAATRFNVETRPDFAILIYPVITFDEKYTHFGTRNNLIGRDYNASLVELYSNEKQVASNTPRTFIAYSNDDDIVSPINGTLFYNALHENNVPAELHIYPTGGHGWGWNPNFKYHKEVTTSLARWLKGE